MELRLKQFNVSRWWDRILFRVFERLSDRVKRKNYRLWRTVVKPVETGGGDGSYIETPTPYSQFKQKSLESLNQQGFTGDAQRQLTTQNSAPLWSKEVGPFLANQLSDHTRRAYECDLKQFFGFLKSSGSLENLNELRPAHIILFRKALEEGRVTGKVMGKTTVNRKLAVIKSFLNWLRLNHVITENAAQLVKGYPQNQESSLKGLSDEEAKKILESPKRNTRVGALHGAILSFLLYTGVRKGELLGLKIGDIDEERGVTVVRVRGKGHRVRILPLTRQVKQAIDWYFHVCRRDKSRKEEPLFTPTKNPHTGTLLKPLNPNSITYIVARYARKAGVFKKISPHSCRATCISHALDKKASHRAVQHLAGWSTPLMIQRYDKRREDLQNSAAYQIDYGDEESNATG